MPSNKSFLSPYQTMSAIALLANYGMPAKRGPVMAMATSVIENFADQIRVCADQGWKINIFIRYIAPFP
ncbi:hypothetical protein [Aeromonas hydrophila]|uniref:hypothetical protein n=1 Tax=Aeromonas hydrophila TaxID=644 RepID=UPI0023614307|nr:hypothetical protein [Aeromonas hydrophila]